MNYLSLINVLNEIYSHFLKTEINVLSFKSSNFGDYFNKPLLESILKQNIHIIDINLYNKLKLEHLYEDKKILIGIGSVIEYSTKNSIVWGTGSIWYDSVPSEAPLEILAVRGLLTRRNLTNRGYSCPEVYGDPGLLAYKYSSHSVAKTHKLGIIPHYSEINSSLLNGFKKNPEVKVIDITNKKNLFDEIRSCETIVSSSLHGLIFADSFQIPTLWITIDNKLYGGDFKFQDYYSSLYNKIDNFKSISILDLDIKKLIKQSSIKQIDIDVDKLENLLKSYYNID